MFASKLESCPQPSLLSVRKFYRVMKRGNVPFFHSALFLLKQLTCTVVISCALDWRLSAHPKRVPTFFDLSPRCVNFGAHNGCNSKPSVSSLLLITLAETSRFLETADGTDLGGKIFKARRKKKESTHNLQNSPFLYCFAGFIIACLFFLFLFCTPAPHSGNSCQPECN